MEILGLSLLAMVIPAAKSDNTVRQYVIASLPDMCPYNDLCKQPASKLLSDNTTAPCCIQCSCDDKCLQFSNCCPDKEFSDSTEDQTTYPLCREQTIQWGEVSPENRKYKVFGHCPADRSDDNISQNCNNPDLNSFENLLWVSDIKTGQIFKNKFCAVCHGVHEFTYWNLGIRSCVDKETDDVSIESLLQNPNCSLWFTPAHGIRQLVTMFLCYEDMITTCNETGRWQRYNETTEVACNLFDMPYITEFITGTVMNVYKNMYCFMCNEFQLITLDLCESVAGKSDTIPFTALLDFDLYLKATENPQSKCNVDEIVDKFLNLCHRLYCPIGQMPSGGSCLTKAITFSAAAIKVVYSVKIVRKADNASEAEQNILEADMADKLSFIRQATGFEDLGCDIVNIDLYVRHNTQNTSLNYFNLFVQILTTQKCDLYTLQLQMVELLGKEVIIDLDNHVVFHFEEITNESYAGLFIAGKLVTGISFPVRIGMSYQLVVDKICPRIKLKHSLMLDLPSNETRRRLLALFTNNDEKNQPLDEIEICVDDYFVIVSDINRAQTFGLTQVLKYSVILCLMTIYLRHFNHDLI